MGQEVIHTMKYCLSVKEETTDMPHQVWLSCSGKGYRHKRGTYHMLYLPEVQEAAKVIYYDRSQNSRYLVVG